MDSQPARSSNWVVWAAVAAVILCLCAVLVIGGAVAIYFLAQDVDTPVDIPVVRETVEPPPPNRPTPASVSGETAAALAEALVPEQDPYDLACRLMAVCGVESTLPAPSRPYAVGDSRKFWVQSQDTIENFEVEVTLRYVTPHSYFWVQEGVEIDEDELAALMTDFENKIYPTNRQFFGSEWSPGVDNDPHIHVLYVTNIGANTGGYFSPFDEYNPLVRRYSNGVELFVLPADAASLDAEYTYGTLAHEFQHMIHWNLDRNESIWINEGFAELASFLNGYTVGNLDLAYVLEPNLSLNDWTSLQDSPDVTTRHYGQAFLFTTYFLDRLGKEATQALARHQENGLTSLDLVFKELNLTDSRTGNLVTVEDFVMDWMLAMYLGDGSVGDGRYVYNNYPDAPQTEATQKIRNCPRAPLNGMASQFGPEYIEITCRGDHVLQFAGSTATGVLPTDAHSGQYAFWSNKGDTSDMTLTREFDFTGVDSRIELSYWTWYDIEDGWDYLYVLASLDGQSWTILKTSSCTEEDLSGNSYGCAYTGNSGGGDEAVWIKESVDLSDYAGKKVRLRFEYVTDSAVNGEGLLLDDLNIQAVNYGEDFEAGEGGWQPEGFARIENILPQTFRLALIDMANEGTSVEYLDLRQDQTATIPISLDSGERAVLVVTGTQRFTRLPAAYTIEVK